MEKKVSVIVATYNHEKYIRHCLESIVTQKTDFEFEVLVGEDCSTDGTKAIVEEYSKKYPSIIVPFYREKNLGMFANIPDLMSHAKGKYIAFLEGDDYWIDDHKLQKQTDFLDTKREYVACFGRCMIVDENENRHMDLEKYDMFKDSEGDYTLEEFAKYILPGQTATSMYRSAAYGEMQKKITDAGIDASRMIDRGMVLCMMSIGKMYNSGEYTAAYRKIMNSNSGSWSSKNDNYSVDNVIQYLGGMKAMEEMASALGLDLDFDERRGYELYKLYENKGTFSKEDTERIRKIIRKEYNSVKKYNEVYRNMKIDKIKSCLKGIIK